MNNPDKKAGATSVTDLIGSDPVGFALTVLTPVTADTAIKKGMQLHEAIDLSKNPEAIRAVDDIALDLIFRMAGGAKIGNLARLLIIEWILRQHELRRRKTGRQRDEAKELAVYFSYRQKLKANPKAQKKAIVSELEEEFGLGRRHIFGIIKKVSPPDKEPVVAVSRTLVATFRRPKNWHQMSRRSRQAWRRQEG
jgi:hypothetical protein